MTFLDILSEIASLRRPRLSSAVVGAYLVFGLHVPS